MSPLRVTWGWFQDRQFIYKPVVPYEPEVRLRTSPDHGIWGDINFYFEAQVRLSLASLKGRDPRHVRPSRPILPVPRAQIILGS